MKFLLQSASPEAYQDLMQLLPLEGFWTEPEMFVKDHKNVNALLREMSEYLMDDQKICVYGLEQSFRGLVGEVKMFAEFDRHIIPVLPGTPDGYMAAKACTTLHLPVVIADIYTPGQILIALNNGTGPIAISCANAQKSMGFSNMLKVVDEILDPSQKERLILVDVRTQEQLYQAMACGIGAAALSPELIQEIAVNLYSESDAANRHEEWLLEYTRAEVLDLDQIRAEKREAAAAAQKENKN